MADATMGRGRTLVEHRGLRDILLSVRAFVWDSLVRVLWRCAYSTGAALAVTLFFVRNDQGQDLLRISAERGASLWNLAFFLGALLLGLANWYTARLLLAREFAPEGLERARSRLGRNWLPRLLGATVPLVIGVGFLRLQTPDPGTSWVLGVLFLLLGAALLWFFIRGRALFLQGSQRGLDAPIQALGALNWALLSGSLAASFLLVVGFVLWPVALPQWPAVLNLSP